jgi:hypothetical protein
MIPSGAAHNEMLLGPTSRPWTTKPKAWDGGDGARIRHDRPFAGAAPRVSTSQAGMAATFVSCLVGFPSRSPAMTPADAIDQKPIPDAVLVTDNEPGVLARVIGACSPAAATISRA